MGDDDTGAGTMRERVPGSPWRLWLLLGADRRLLTGLVLGVVFLVLLGLDQGSSVQLRSLMADSAPVETLFQALVTAIITGVTLVVTLSQLVLSQELVAVGDQADRMDGAMAFRRDVESHIEHDVSPPDPASFLRSIVESARREGAALAGTVGRNGDDEIAAFADGLVADADAVASELDEAQFGTFEVVFAALNFNYAGKIYEARRLRASVDVDDAVDTALDEIVGTLTRFGPAREHVKTLYFQWELIDLARTIVYVAVPALVISIGMLLYGTDPGVVPGQYLGVEGVVWLVAATTTVAVAPFVLLLVYILRIVTVAKRTLAIGPLVLRDTVRSGDDERDGE